MRWNPKNSAAPSALATVLVMVAGACGTSVGIIESDGGAHMDAAVPDATTEAGDAAPAETRIEGWQGFADTRGGLDGQVIKVTNLDESGPGSLRSAIETTGPRVVVFEVGGVIDLDGSTIKIKEPHLTIAGQTAPSPGITLIKGGVTVSTHDVVIQHIRVRAGEAGHDKGSGWEVDSIATSGGDAHDIIIDHCSVSWGTDENLSASGPRFEGSTPEEWRRGTSHRVTFSHCIVAEGLNDSTHDKGPHSKGSLIHDNVSDMTVVGNLYISNVRRNPYFKGGVRGVVANNYVYNPVEAAVRYNLSSGEWGDNDWVTGHMTLVGNVLQHGPDTEPDLALATFGNGPCLVYEEDNIAVDRSGNPVAILDGDRDDADDKPIWPDGLLPIPAADLKDYVVQHVGARPRDRDFTDQRLADELVDGRGSIIDSENEVGGYPEATMTTRPLDVPSDNLEEWLQVFTDQVE